MRSAWGTGPGSVHPAKVGPTALVGATRYSRAGSVYASTLWRSFRTKHECLPDLTHRKTARERSGTGGAHDYRQPCNYPKPLIIARGGSAACIYCLSGTKQR